MDKRTDNVIEMSWIVWRFMDSSKIQDFPAEQIKEWISDWADDFDEEYIGANWDKLSYYDEIDKFTKKNIALKLWLDFGDVSIDHGTDDICEDWNGFRKGTSRYCIWHWFEDTFGVSVALDLMTQ